MPPEFGRVQRGDWKIPAGLLNAHSDALEALHAAASGGGFDFGVFSAPPQPDYTFLARITATDGGDPPLYSWEKVQQTEGGGTITHPDSGTGAVSGEPGNYPACEQNGNPDVPVGAVVRLRPAEGWSYWWFDYGTTTFAVRLDDDSATVAPATQLTFPAGSFALSVLGTSDAYVVPRFGDDIQPVGPANLPGTSPRFAREDHVHRGLAPVTNITNVNIADVTVEGASYYFAYSQEDGQPYIVGPDGFIFDLCTCLIVTPPAYYCAPGTCGDYCEEAPGEWSIPVAGFGADRAIFNRDWLLKASGTCTWTETALVDGLTLTGTLVLDGGGYTLTLTDGATTVVYDAGPPADLDCCALVTFTPADGCESSPLGGACGFCEDAVPQTVRMTVAGATGDLADLNGDWAFVHTVASCWWVGYKGNEVAFLELRETGWVVTAYASGAGLGRYVWWIGTEPVADCCAEATIGGLLYGGGATGTAPTTVTLTPECPCPASLTATPTCCSTVCDCEYCPDGALWTYLLTASGFTGDCAALNGTWELRWSADCTWVGTLGDATCTLALSSATAATLTFTQAEVDDVVYSTAVWDCCDGAVFEDSDVAACGAAPATLTVTPGGADCGPCEGPPVEVDCCTGDAIAQRLYLDFADDTDCACADSATTVELVYDAGDQSWKGSGTLCGLALDFKFHCYSPPDGWALEAPGSADFGGSTGLPTTCSPFVWDETGSVNNSDCTGGGNGTVSFVISDVPP